MELKIDAHQNVSNIVAANSVAVVKLFSHVEVFFVLSVFTFRWCLWRDLMWFSVYDIVFAKFSALLRWQIPDVPEVLLRISLAFVVYGITLLLFLITRLVLCTHFDIISTRSPSSWCVKVFLVTRVLDWSYFKVIHHMFHIRKQIQLVSLFWLVNFI